MRSQAPLEFSIKIPGTTRTHSEYIKTERTMMTDSFTELYGALEQFTEHSNRVASSRADIGQAIHNTPILTSRRIFMAARYIRIDNILSDRIPPEYQSFKRREGPGPVRFTARTPGDRKIAFTPDIGHQTFHTDNPEICIRLQSTAS